MARRTSNRKQANTAHPDKRCRDCGHHYDECSPAIDGHMILCHCPFYTDGKYCVFLNDRACDKFKPME